MNPSSPSLADIRRSTVAELERHWTTHAIEQFLTRYDPEDYEPDAFVGLVDRIEAKFGLAFESPYWATRPRVMIVADLMRRNNQASPKIRIIYVIRDRMVITVYPLKLEKGRRLKIPILKL